MTRSTPSKKKPKAACECTSTSCATAASPFSIYNTHSSPTMRSRGKVALVTAMATTGVLSGAALTPSAVAPKAAVQPRHMLQSWVAPAAKLLHAAKAENATSKAVTAATAEQAAKEEEDPLQKAWDKEPSYASHYSSDTQRPNVCKIAHKVPAAEGTKQYEFNPKKRDYIPYIGTSVVRDSQLLLTRLYYSIDYPVKWFVVVAGQQTVAGRNAIAYQVKHMLEFPQDKVGVVIITCDHQPAVTESWNAIFQTFKDEPFGLYMARDTFWERGALQKLAPHGWDAAETGKVEYGFVRWSNMGVRDAIHNIFMLTSQGVKRFGLFDENIYYAFCEDLDMIIRAKVMDPPLKEKQFHDVRAVHGKRAHTTYISGTGLADDPHEQGERNITQMTGQRYSANCNYFMRKWGCPSELTGDWMARMIKGECKFKTPFNQKVPHWAWHTSKALRHRDHLISVQHGHLVDSRSNTQIFKLPPHYGTWEGYFEQTGICRLSGYLGRKTAADNRTMCL